jgi:hypothetical protein
VISVTTRFPVRSCATSVSIPPIIATPGDALPKGRVSVARLLTGHSTRQRACWSPRWTVIRTARGQSVVGRLAAIRDELVADVPLGIQRDAPGQAAFPVGIAHVAPKDRLDLWSRRGSCGHERFPWWVHIDPPKCQPRHCVRLGNVVRRLEGAVAILDPPTAPCGVGPTTSTLRAWTWPSPRDRLHKGSEVDRADRRRSARPTIKRKSRRASLSQADQNPRYLRRWRMPQHLAAHPRCRYCGSI